MIPAKRRPPLALLLTGAAFIAALLLIPWAVFAQSDSTAPTNLTAGIVDGGVALNWDAPADDAEAVTGYEILRRQPRQGENTLLVYVADTGSTDTSYTDANATEPGELYVYGVKALRGGEKSGRSNYVNVDIPEAEPEPTPSAPAQPTGLNAAATHDSVALAWDAPQDQSITGYQILRRSRDGSNYGDGKGAPEFVVIAESASTSATYTDNTVEPETRYVYRVKAVNDRGVSERSSYANAETPAAPASTPEPTPEPTPSAPAQPTGLNAAATHDSVALSWDDPQDQSITGYRILRRSRDGSNYGDGKGAPEFVVIAESASTAATYTDNTVEPETRYVYRVKAVNDRGVSERSSYANAETPAAPASTPEPTPESTPSAPAQPTGLNAAATHDSVMLIWDDAQDESITGYGILRRETDRQDPGVFTTINEDTASAAATYTDNTVEPETKYVYRVRAINDHGLSEPSGPVNAKTPAEPRIARQGTAPGAPGVSSVTDGGYGSLAVAWSAPNETGGADIIAYDVRHILTAATDKANANWTVVEAAWATDPGGDLAYTIAGLTPGEDYDVQVRAFNSAGYGGWSATTAAASGTFTLVPYDWSLRPDSVAGGQSFRLLFVASELKWGAWTDIAKYDNVVQLLVASGHPDIQKYGSQFRMLGSTAAISARDHTRTNTTFHGDGEPVYWLDGPRVADNYADFYDGWDNSNPTRTETGASFRFRTYSYNNDPQADQAVWTGTTQDGLIKPDHYLGSLRPGLGIPSIADETLASLRNNLKRAVYRFYGLSGVFRVADPPPTTSTLNSLTVDPVNIYGFNSDRTTYYVGVAATVAQVTITAVPSSSKATGTYDRPDADPGTDGHQVDLSPGVNTVSVTVTAQDGVSTRTYTIHVGRGVLLAGGIATGVINGESGPVRHRVALLPGHSYRFTVTGGEIAAPRIGLISAYRDVVAESGDVVVAEGGGELTVHRDHWYQGWMGSSYPHFHEEAKRRDANPCADRDCGPTDAASYGTGPGASLRYRYFPASSVFDASRRYFVEVRGGYRDTGRAGYTISLEELSDDFSSAEDTTGAVAVGGSADGAVDFEHDVDWSRVSLEAGASYQISVATRSGTGVSDALEQPQLVGVYDAGGFYPASGYYTSASGGRESRTEASFTAAAAGVYYIAVASEPSAGQRVPLHPNEPYSRIANKPKWLATYSYEDATGAYTVSVAETADGNPDRVSEQPGRDFPAAVSTPGRLEVGSVGVTGEIHRQEDRGAGQSRFDEDWFGVTLKANTTYLVEIEGRAAIHGQAANLRHPAYHYLVRGYSEDYGWGRLRYPDVKGIYSDGGASIRQFEPRPRLEFTTGNRAGRYYIAAGAYGGNNGHYRLRLAERVTGALDAADASAPKIQVGGMISGVIDVQGDTDVFRFDMVKGERYTITLRSHSGYGTLADPQFDRVFISTADDAVDEPVSHLRCGISHYSTSQYVGKQDLTFDAVGDWPCYIRVASGRFLSSPASQIGSYLIKVSGP